MDARFDTLGRVRRSGDGESTEHVNIEAVTASAKPLTLADLKDAGTRTLPVGLMVFTTSDDSAERGARIACDPNGPLKTQTIVYVVVTLCHDKRVRVMFGRPDNVHDDVVIFMREEFDQISAFTAAIRIIVGNSDSRFRSKRRVHSFVKKHGVSEVAKSLPHVFGEFMFAVLHAFNCKLGKDVKVLVQKLREHVRPLVPHLSEQDVVRIYREEVVSWVDKL